jgi:hypothetical protein
MAKLDVGAVGANPNDEVDEGGAIPKWVFDRGAAKVGAPNDVAGGGGTPNAKLGAAACGVNPRPKVGAPLCTGALSPLLNAGTEKGAVPVLPKEG